MLIPVIVGITRIIRCVHYPSDVLGGMIFGIIAGLIGYLVATKLLPVISNRISQARAQEDPGHASAS